VELPKIVKVGARDTDYVVKTTRMSEAKEMSVGLFLEKFSKAVFGPLIAIELISGLVVVDADVHVASMRSEEGESDEAGVSIQSGPVGRRCDC